MAKIGFIGLGHMGRPMMLNLLKQQHEVVVYDVIPAALKAVENKGIKQTADSVKTLAAASDVIISSVQTGKQVYDLCMADNGIFQSAKPGTLYIDCSSIDISTTRQLHELAKQHGIAMLDAPVSGGVAGAEAATLTFMVGGQEPDYQKALPILSAMGKKIVYAGAAGAGQAAKICNNLLLGISMVGVAEAFTLASKLGLDAQKFFDISSNASGQCWSMTSYCPVPGILENSPASHNYEPGFMAKMMLKDLRLGQQAAREVNAAIPLGAEAAELYELYINQGMGEKDFSGIIKMIAGEK